VFRHVLLYLLIRFENVDRQNKQALVGEFLGYIVDHRGFCLAVLTPSSPELEEYYLPFTDALLN
jgi:hypothetical protein